MTPIDLLILSNGPGEVSTWVRPVVQALRQRLGWNREQFRISLVLAPCSHATGQEVAIAQRYDEIDRIQPAAGFFPFLLRGKTQANWDWHCQGIVLFLGGDQLFPVIIAKRLGYRTVIYAEWEARWLGWVDRFGVMSERVLNQVPPKYVHKCRVVGDLMAEATRDGQTSGNVPGGSQGLDLERESIGLLPGSKAAKLGLGVPLMLAIAEQIQHQLPQVHFWIPVAPTLSLETLARFAQTETNPLVPVIDGVTAELVIKPEGRAYFKTETGLRVDLDQTFPAYERLAHCQLCLTTVGANTAELGSLGVPMLVLLPTQQLDVMRAWDGIPGILVNLPILGRFFARIINGWFVQRKGLLAWPNIWAGEEIVPELMGALTPAQVARQVVGYLQEPQQLAQMRSRLRQVRGAPGAAAKLVELVVELLD